jgi:FAD/FMN-containing dehydrogenase
VTALVPPPQFRGIFRDDLDARAVYSEAAGIGHVLPRAIAVPRDENDVALLVRWAAAERIALIPRGSGSSMASGAIGDGIVVDLSRLDAIAAVNVADRSVWVGPGAVCDDVNRAASAAGLRLPVDPSSARFCTIGGMTACNAAGAHTLHFGSTRAWVRALRCVFADGSIAEARRGVPFAGVTLVEDAIRDLRAEITTAPRHVGVRKDSSGYALSELLDHGELVDLLVGSEGTLAIFVGVELALAPAAGATSSVLGAFSRLEDAVTAAVQARDAGAVACELLDRTFLEVASSAGHGYGIPPTAEAALLAEVEGADATAAAASALRLESMFRTTGADTVRVALDPPTEEELWELRHAASPILARLDPSLKSMQFIEDGAVPPERLADYVRGIREILRRADVRGVIFGHAGDAHVHVNPLIDVSQADWRVRVEQILAEAAELTASLGGSLTGEHGDGRLRTPLLGEVWGSDAIHAFARVKHAFDPASTLNPGVKIPLPGQRPLGEIKYDPALPSIPQEARRALERVERERAYARFRLDLLVEQRLSSPDEPR